MRCAREKKIRVSFIRKRLQFDTGGDLGLEAHVVDELEHGLAGVDEHLDARAVAAQPATGLRERVLSRHTCWSDIAGQETGGSRSVSKERHSVPQPSVRC